MYCNHCGVGEQVAKSYCRHCGKWIGKDPPEERLTVMVIFNGLSALFGTACAVLLFATVFGGLGYWTVNLAATFCAIIAIHQTVSFFFALSLKQRMKLGREERPEELAQA